MLAALCVVPLVFGLRRSWLGISVFGHIALLVAVFPVNIALHNAGATASYASLGDAAESAALNTSAGFWLLAVCALLPFCVLNHVAFFRDRRRQATG